MNIVITGANGFVGQGLVRKLCTHPFIGSTQITHLTLLERCFNLNNLPTHTPTIEMSTGDLSDKQWLHNTLSTRPIDVLYHLASIPGGMAETDPELAQQVNIEATVQLLNICRYQMETTQRRAKFIFASSIAVYGKMPELVTDDTPLQPQMSYGVHKVIGEMMVSDYNRRGWIDGQSLRLPGVLTRPPQKTGQLSAFLSDMVTYVSQGKTFVCPMSPGSRTWASSLPNVIYNLIHSATLSQESLHGDTTFTLPTCCFSMSELVDAIGEVYEQDAINLVNYQPDSRIERLFGNFPPLVTSIASRAGFKPDKDLNELVKQAVVFLTD
ncbi:NAD-dependent epimerase/dehydratase family protein [Vibrio alginolyticus]|nr:NAD-dependent epimerase/dehydratase family protein [Vibrio alginolyticus]